MGDNPRAPRPLSGNRGAGGSRPPRLPPEAGSPWLGTRSGPRAAAVLWAAVLLVGTLVLAGCQTAQEPRIVRHNYEKNYAVRQILLGYYAIEDVPSEVIAAGRRKMQATIPCSGFVLLEDGMTDRSETARTYDAFTKSIRTYVETKTYYWQRYRCKEPFRPAEPAPAEPVPPKGERPGHKPIP